MDNSATFFATVLASFFAIMNPVANTPIFLGLTQEMDEKTTRQVALRGVALAFVIVAVFSTAGKYIFDIFGVTLPAFRIAGGQRMTQVLGKNFLMVISRLMGLILAVIGAQMLIEGVRGAIQAAAN
jgi:small neutral amino acid transporter SnatA (MarC family)